MNARKRPIRTRTPTSPADAGELRALRLWYHYNAELRPKYLEAIASMPVKQRIRNDGASFPLFEIFLHVLDSYRWWLRFVYRNRIPSLSAWTSIRFRTNIRNLGAARRVMNRTTREVLRFVDHLKERDLDRVIDFSAPANDGWTQWRHERITLRAILWHMVEEELQHRGEMNALLWRHGEEPPVIGYHEWTHEWRTTK